MEVDVFVHLLFWVPLLKYPKAELLSVSLSLAMPFILKSVWPDVSIATPAFSFQLPFSPVMFFRPFPSSLFSPAAFPYSSLSTHSSKEGDFNF